MEVITVSPPNKAMQRLGLRGAFPKMPFLHYTFPEVNLAKTTYLAQAHTTSSSAALNLME
jgi:hypothetical protein